METQHKNAVPQALEHCDDIVAALPVVPYPIAGF